MSSLLRPLDAKRHFWVRVCHEARRTMQKHKVWPFFGLSVNVDLNLKFSKIMEQSPVARTEHLLYRGAGSFERRVIDVQRGKAQEDLINLIEALAAKRW